MKTVLFRKEDIYRGNLILINRDNPIRVEEEIKRNLVPVANSHHLLNREASDKIHQILIKVDLNNEIRPVSCFRSKEEQENLYNQSIRDNGMDFTRKYVARPDTSEHQSGLAIDLGENKPDIDFICPSFPYHGVFNKFRRLAKLNGFIERYKEDKEQITGISKEPWHFRYVGYPHSLIIEEAGLALEEYHDFVREFDSEENSYLYRDTEYTWSIFYVGLVDDIMFLDIKADYYSISGNNRDGFIITCRK